MEEVVFVIKCLVVTFVVIVGLQIRIGGQTAENHLMGWLHHSSISHGLQDVAEGAVKFAHKSKDTVVGFVSSEPAVAENPAPTVASNTGWFKIKRSAAYQRQKERERKLDGQHRAQTRHADQDAQTNDQSNEQASDQADSAD